MAYCKKMSSFLIIDTPVEFLYSYRLKNGF